MIGVHLISECLSVPPMKCREDNDRHHWKNQISIWRSRMKVIFENVHFLRRRSEIYSTTTYMFVFPSSSRKTYSNNMNSSTSFSISISCWVMWLMPAVMLKLLQSPISDECRVFCRFWLRGMRKPPALWKRATGSCTMTMPPPTRHILSRTSWPNIESRKFLSPPIHRIWLRVTFSSFPKVENAIEGEAV